MSRRRHSKHKSGPIYSADELAERAATNGNGEAHADVPTETPAAESAVQSVRINMEHEGRKQDAARALVALISAYNAVNEIPAREGKTDPEPFLKAVNESGGNLNRQELLRMAKGAIPISKSLIPAVAHISESQGGDIEKLEKFQNARSAFVLAEVKARVAWDASPAQGASAAR